MQLGLESVSREVGDGRLLGAAQQDHRRECPSERPEIEAQPTPSRRYQDLPSRSSNCLTSAMYAA